MSEYNFYLVPVDEPSAGRRGIANQARDFLEQRGIIGGLYDKALGWFAAGPKSKELFTDVTVERPAFEYAILYNREEAHFVPDSPSAAKPQKARTVGIGIGIGIEKISLFLPTLICADGANDSEEFHIGGFGARCSNCQADLDELVHESLEEQGEGEEATDAAARDLYCPECRFPNSLVTLQAEVDTAATRFYINFCAVDSFSLNPSILEGLQAIAGTEFRRVGERL